jgi:hypothetical protein
LPTLTSLSDTMLGCESDLRILISRIEVNGNYARQSRDNSGLASGMHGQMTKYVPRLSLGPYEVASRQQFHRSLCRELYKLADGCKQSK